MRSEHVRTSICMLIATLCLCGKAHASSWLDDTVSVPRADDKTEVQPTCPFSFTLDGRPGRELLRDWRRASRSETLDAGRTRTVTTWTDSATGLRVEYDAPGAGKLRFGWKGPLKLDGKDIPLSGFKRFDNPYCQADFDSHEFTIEAGGSRLFLDFSSASRTVED